MYIFARLFDAVARPSALVLICCVLGLVLTLRRPASRLGRKLLIAGVAALVAFAVLPLSTWMLRPLEARFPQPNPAHVDGIIVLGGAVSVPRSIDRGAPQLNALAGRMTTFAMLAQRYPMARLGFTGGNGDPFNPARSEAEFARVLFDGIGIRTVVYENASRNTRENALKLAPLMKPEPGETWLLVTSAADLPRAVGTFRSAGWPVTGYPADYHTSRRGTGFFPGLAEGLSEADWAAHEWIGLVYYRLRGWTPTLFPGPSP